jgi:AcrR family transcriptional regulator
VTATVLSVGDHTRGRILHVALELISEQGFAATSTRELSERLGFTKAALYYHFRTKDDLLTALITPAIDELTSLVSSAHLQPAAAARREVLTSYVDYVIAYRTLMRVLTQDPAVASRRGAEDYQPQYTRLTELLAGHDAPTTGERTRVRAALGAVRAALIFSEPDDDPACLRANTLAAACGALGIPGPRRTKTETTPADS